MDILLPDARLVWPGFEDHGDASGIDLVRSLGLG